MNKDFDVCDYWQAVGWRYEDGPQVPETGLCRRYPPSLTLRVLQCHACTRPLTDEGGWPVTLATSWCGEWVAKR